MRRVACGAHASSAGRGERVRIAFVDVLETISCRTSRDRIWPKMAAI